MTTRRLQRQRLAMLQLLLVPQHLKRHLKNLQLVGCCLVQGLPAKLRLDELLKKQQFKREQSLQKRSALTLEKPRAPKEGSMLKRLHLLALRALSLVVVLALERKVYEKY